MRLNNLIQSFFILTGCVLLLTACATPLRINITASKLLNPDDSKHALPVQVIVYQLNDDQAFRQATFQQLWRHDKTTLGSALLKKRELTIAPGSHSKLILQRDSDLAYVGVIAIFRHPSAGHWRVLQKINKGMPMMKKNLNFYLHDNSIRRQ